MAVKPTFHVTACRNDFIKVWNIFPLFFGHCTVDMIPQRGGYTKKGVAILIMMNTMVYPEGPENIFGRCINVHNVMDQEVRSIADEKSRQKSENIVTQDYF